MNNKDVKKMILLKKIKKIFVSGVVIEDLSFVLGEGKTLIIHGPSGSGKSTLLRLIAGIEILDAGEIWLNGILVTNQKRVIVPSYHRSIGFVFQFPSLFPHMTVYENIMFAVPDNFQGNQKKVIEDLLVQAGIFHIRNKHPHEISGGEAQRVSILRALAAQSRYLLLDEPFTDLDPDMKIRMIQMVFGYISDKNITTIVVTHDREDSQVIGAPVVNMDKNLKVDIR